MNKTCRTCHRMTIEKTRDGRKVEYCPYFKSIVDPDKDGCNRYSYPQEKYVCEVCGHPILSLTGTGFLEGVHLVCPECLDMGYGCHTCHSGKTCGVANDKSGRPQLVQQAVVQGNVQMVTQVINPELVDEYCKHCECWLHREEQCFKNSYNGLYCENYKSVFRYDD